MSNYRGRRGSNPKTREEEEVAELLRAAEDDVLLKLSLNSHRARSSSSSSDLDQDLLRRFEALKLPSDSSKIKSVPPLLTQRHNEEDDGDAFEKAVGADLSARFSALRNPSSSSSSSTAIDASKQKFEEFGIRDDDDDHDEEDEISKVIQWAIDEARLNPSSVDDEDDDDDDDGEEIKGDRKTKPHK